MSITNNKLGPLIGTASRTLVLAVTLVAACSKGAPSIAIPEAGKDAVAVVNGVPITIADLDMAMRRGQHGSEDKPGERKIVIENLVNAELVRQAAVAKGLDKLPENKDKLNRLFAQFMAAQRTEMADLFFSNEVAAKAVVSDAEAQAYFDRHADQLANEYHIVQVLIKKDVAKIEEIKRDLDGGTSFEEVLAKRFPEVPASAPSPWDLGFLRWSQLPTEWHEEINRLQPGEVSEIIKGAGQRFWVLKLVEKRRNENLVFETEKPIVIEMLQRAKLAELRARVMEDLKKSATIKYTDTDGQQ